MSNKDSIAQLLQYFKTTRGPDLELNEAAIVSASQKSNYHQSLAIKILAVFGGFLASLAFLGFLFITGLYDSTAGLLVLGAICIGGAILLNKKFDKIIMDTLSVASFIIGFCLLGYGLDKSGTNEQMIMVVFIIIALLSLMIVQNYMLSFIAVIIVTGSCFGLIIFNDHYNLIHIYVCALAIIITWFFVAEATIITASAAFAKLYSPVRIGLLFSFFFGLTMLGKKGLLAVSPGYIWISSVVIIATILYLLVYLFKHLHVEKTAQQAAVYIVTVLLLLPTVFSPAIPGAILIILLSFLVNYKTGFVIGIIAFIYFIGQYYYDLHFTLLTKSILMFSSGILFTGIYLLLHKKLTADEKI